MPWRADAELSSERTRWRRRGRASIGWAIVLACACASRVARADEPGLTIETGSPDALCPDLATARAAVERRLGQLVVPGGGRFTARYTSGHAPAGTPRDFVRLELRGPDGSQQLSRDLPLDGESCSTMAEAIALVLDRHFRAFGPEAPSEPPAPAASPSPASAPPAPVADDLGGGREAPQAPARGDDTFVAELAFREPDQPALGGRVLFGLWPHGLLGVALHVDLAAEHETLPGGGEVMSRELSARAFAAWAPRFGRLDAYLGPGLRLSVARGTSRDVPDAASGYRLRPCLGADAGVLWHVAERWSLSASAALDAMVPRMGGWFAVGGADVLEPAPVRVWLGLGVGYAATQH